MSRNFVITVARGFGSGGKDIGTRLADKLGIKLIDRNLLSMASIKSGISEELFGMADEKVRKRFFDFRDDKQYDYELIPPECEDFLSDKNLFNWEARVLLELSLVDSYVVIGRAADFVLRHTRNCLSVNIQAELEDCVVHTVNRTYVSEKDAVRMVKETDKYRADFYKTYTGREWRDSLNYDLCLNTSRLTREKCINIIISTAQEKFRFDLQSAADRTGEVKQCQR
jgi:cytidylate kinase